MNTETAMTSAPRDTQLPSLRQAIQQQGRVLPGGVLVVDSFLNQQVDMPLMSEIGQAFALHNKQYDPTIVITIESSGIAPAAMTALHMGLPLLIAKKQASRLTRGQLLTTRVHSFTKDTTYELSLPCMYLRPGARVLFVDDFLAMGEAALGVCRLTQQAGASMVGIGIVIEKTFQPGRAKLESLGIPITSLARIAFMDDTQSDPARAVTFV